MEKLCIDVRGFSDEKKRRVQDAFFELGYGWDDGCTYQYLGAGRYGNVYRDGDASGTLLNGYVDMSEQQREYAITYAELMCKAGMDESDPDPDAEQAPPKKIGKLTLGVELTTDLQSTIHNYICLLNKTYDEKARELIESQLVDLMDLQYQQLTGENNNA